MRMFRPLRRVIRRSPLIAVFVLLGLAVSQVVYAAPPQNLSFTIDPTSPQVGDSVTFSADSQPDEGETVIYQWDFGDGSPVAIGQQVSHTYASAGDKTVTLTATDSGVLPETATTTGTVRVNTPPDPTISGETTTPVRQSINLTASPTTDSDGDPVTYTWNFGPDGSGRTTGSSVNPSWTTDGTKNVTVTATDGRGGSGTDTHTVTVTNTPPTVTNIGVSPPTPGVGQEVSFFSNARDPNPGDQLTYQWSFGDGQTSSAEEPTHTYTSARTYRVTLTVTDESNDSSAPATRDLMVQLSVPNGSFTTSPAAPLPGQAVTFTSTSSPSAGKTISNVEWDFDYNATSGAFSVDATGSSVSRAFSAPGVKSVAMRVSEGPNGGFDIVPGTVTVNAPPQAAFLVAPTRPFVGDTVTLSSTSSDADGPLARQDWDLDNDGQFDDASAGVVSTRFRRSGTYTLRLRVTDSQGATAVAIHEIRVRRRRLAVLPSVIVRLEGNVFGAATRVTGLVVSAPRRARVTVRCLGKRVGRGCPRKVVKMSKSRRGLRFKTFQRSFRPRMKIIVTTTRKGYIGKHTTFIIRRGVGPLRRSQCITPGAKRPKKCPGA